MGRQARYACVSISIHVLRHSGTLLQDIAFKKPQLTLFFHSSPTKLIVACEDDIFIVDMNTQSRQPFSGTPKGSYYFPHALALSDDDAVLVAGNSYTPYNVCGYDTSSRTRLWIHDTASQVGAVGMHGAQVLVTVAYSPTLLLDLMTGAQIAALQKADGSIDGLGVIEGSCFILRSCHPHRPPHLRVPRHAATPPLQTSQASASATGDVGLDS